MVVVSKRSGGRELEVVVDMLSGEDERHGEVINGVLNGLVVVLGVL